MKDVAKDVRVKERVLRDSGFLRFESRELRRYC